MNYLRESGLLTPTSKLLAAGLLLFGASACSDDELVKDDPANEKTEQQTSALTVITDPSQMPVTVYNYGNGSRDVAEDVDMPEIPDYTSVPETTVNGGDLPTTDCVLVGENKGGLPHAGQRIFIKGSWTITGIYNPGINNNEGNIYVLPGGKLILGSDVISNYSGNALRIVNYGTIETENGENHSAKIEGVTLYNAGTIKLNNFEVGCRLYSFAPIEMKNIHFYLNAYGYFRCSLKAESVISDNESVFHFGYTEIGTFNLRAAAAVCIFDGGMMNVGSIDISNVQSTHIYAEDNGIALLDTDKMRLNDVGGDNLKGTFTNLNILCDEFIYGENVEPTKEAMGFNASVTLNETGSYKIVEQDDACAPKIVEEPTEDPTPDIETVTFIDNEHTHPISATCIQFNGDYSYMSWHEMGSGIHGCIEVLKMTPEGIKLQAFAEDETTDFNHILFDNDRLLTVGHNAKTAIVGEIAIPGGTFTQGATLNYYKLKSNSPGSTDAGDGNCIIRNGEYIQVASYAGLHTLNNDLTRYNEGRTGFVPTSGSGKHLAIAGDKVLTFNLTERIQGAQSSPAELRWFGNTDYEWTNPTTVASDLTVAPVDGKNTIAFDAEGAMYVCLGHEGFKKFVGNAEVASFKNDAPCNGIAVDDKFVYVANGPAFLIFKKNDLSKPLVRLSHTAPYKQDRKPSCNYVAVKGDLIYIAYGRDGVDVLRFNNRDKF